MDIDLIASRIGDACRICENSSFPKFVGFLRPEETAIAEKTAEKFKADFVFYGGYEDAERIFFGVFPDWCDEPYKLFPIVPLTFTYRRADTLTHREFLGSFMSLGITRETVGDILIEEGRAVVFFTKEVAPYVKEQIRKISNVGVEISEGFFGELPGKTGFLEISYTLSSARLDCVVASLAGTSRSEAADMIENKLVTVNSICCEKTVTLVRKADKISIRSKGKFIIESIDEKTKKGRLKLKAKKYI